MQKLYRGKYLIAIYDSNDELVEVAGDPRELKMFKNEKTARSVISRAFTHRQCPKKIFFIDVFDTEDDVFAEEDKEFLTLMGLHHNNKIKKYK